MRLTSIFCLLLSCDRVEKVTTDTFLNGDATEDKDNDGFDVSEDCDDNNSNTHPDAMEICDGFDNDCDGDIDEDVLSVFYFDADGDGFGSEDEEEWACEAPADFVENGGDCDDQNNTVYPSAAEQCDDIDNDCNGIVDDDLTTAWYADLDGDGFGDADDVQEACLQPDAYIDNSDDCDDTDDSVYPDAEEVCDEKDNDCDGEVDEDVLDTYFYDWDLDGYGDDSEVLEACEAPEGYSAIGGDCDDLDTWTNPGVDEYCGDWVDNNCDGLLDDSTSTDATNWYQDVDNDGHGDPNVLLRECEQPLGYVLDDQDCDDNDATVYPLAAEVCDGQSNDCQNGTLSSAESDDDSDGYVECSIDLSGWDGDSAVVGGDDCDDGDASIYSGAAELCDGQINDCESVALSSDETDDDEDGYVECSIDTGGWDGDSAVVGGDDCDDTQAAFFTSFVWYLDADGDGDGDPNVSIVSCGEPDGYVSNSNDCNDADDTAYFGALELCDGQINDCQVTALSSDEIDDDGDGYVECSIDTDGWDGDSAVMGGDDCDDTDISAFTSTTWYADLDGDLYGDVNSVQLACNQPSNAVAVSGDCDDGNAQVNPDASETCNALDDDCDGQIDETGSLNSSNFYLDFDEDGYGDSTQSILSCTAPTGYVSDATDCDDADATEYPGVTWYADSDGDGFGDLSSTSSCSRSSSSDVLSAGDCDDGNAAVNSGASEVCDGLDNNCDSQTDEGVTTTYYLDSDYDGYGNPSVSTQECSQPSGYVTNASDCDDGDATEYPGVIWYADSDGDSYGSNSNVRSCSRGASSDVQSSGDCNDGDFSINPGASEQCNLVDNNCNGQLDDGITCRIPIYRGFNSSNGHHLYSSTASEVGSGGFSYEGLVFYLYTDLASGTSPLYRCYSASSNKRLLTTDSGCESLANGYVEGVIGFIANSSINGSTTLYRSYHAPTDNHLYTYSIVEHSGALGAGYIQETSPGYVWTTP